VNKDEIGGETSQAGVLVNCFIPYTMMTLAVVIGGGSLLLFGTFLLIGPIPIIYLNASEFQVLLWDGLLSILFFIQHSGMIRTSFRNWLAPIIPPRYHAANYAIASGIVLGGLALLWQPSQTVLYEAQGLIRFLARAISVLAIVGFASGVRALSNFDTFGLVPIKVHLRGKQLRPPAFIARGPYLWVRHPLYFFMIVLIWSAPEVSSDRLLFNVLWTLWIIVGSYLEERDLVAEFGEKYRDYQKTVPMLFPWRFRRG
jgi:protein-S-isoprenylcysteine O-methyltransferase Ste14